MKKIETVIVDDEKNSIRILKHVLDMYCPEITLVGEAFDVDGAIDLIESKRPQLVFLDIELGSKNCFDLLETIPYKEFKIVFITAHEEFAIKVFEYNVIDYLLKPIDVEQINRVHKKLNNDIFNQTNTLFNQLNSLINTMNSPLGQGQDFINVSNLNKVEFIKLKELVFLKSDGRCTIFHLKNGKKIVSTKHLGEYENLLGNNGFFRIHKSFIVNVSYISEIDKTNGAICELTNGFSIPIARRRLEGFNEFIHKN